MVWQSLCAGHEKTYLVGLLLLEVKCGGLWDWVQMCFSELVLRHCTLCSTVTQLNCRTHYSAICFYTWMLLVTVALFPNLCVPTSWSSFKVYSKFDIPHRAHHHSRSQKYDLPPLKPFWSDVWLSPKALFICTLEFSVHVFSVVHYCIVHLCLTGRSPWHISHTHSDDQFDYSREVKSKFERKSWT